MNKHFALSPVRIRDRWFVIAYDLARGSTIAELTDYSLHASTDLQLSRLTLEKRIGQLLNFWAFLKRENILVEEISDAVLVQFRDDELQRVLKRKTSRGNELKAKRTVNDKLGAVYAWLGWMVGSGRLPHCGATRPIRRTVLHGKTPAIATAVGRGTVSFRRTGSGSKTRSGYVATAETHDAITDKFFAGQSLYAAHRNALILAIADAVGFRRGSIASLCTKQFDRAELERELQAVVLVRPPSQKFSYEHDFPFPVWLALRICDFCEAYRAPLVEQKKVTPTQTQDRIFLSSRDAHPLSERAITQIFSKAMRAVGAPKGAALHAFRAKFANDQIEQELDVRTRSGMDTSSSAVAAAVAMKLGQKSFDSIYSYVVAAQTSAALRERTDAAAHVDRLTARVRELQMENKRLRKSSEQ
ncbi:hypothetical protein [Variovorax sp. AFSI2.2]|uniref:hypothetical protein n=1 Tax=Variovorax sp. AFSI2.2 TaxID=3384160 RepID=UPI003EBDB1BB